MGIGTPGSRGPTSRGGRQRGVTVVEYALAISLVLVACLGGLQALQASASQRLRDDASLGAPDLPDLGVSTTTAVTTTPTSSGATTTTTAATVTANATIVTATNGRHGNDWSPTVTIRVVDGSGNALTNAVVTARWDEVPIATVNPSPCTVTAPAGNCTFQLPNLEARPDKTGYVSSVTFTVVSITGTNPTVSYAPTSPLTATLTP